MIANYFRRAGLSLFIITVAALPLFASRLNAQPQEQAEDKPSHEIDSYVRYIPGRSVDAMPGKVNIKDGLYTEFRIEIKP